MRLDRFDNADFDRGRPRWVEIGWRLVSDLLVDTWLPGSAWRRWLLRRFGARIDAGVVIKPRVRIKFPWRLAVGEHCWIGESVWIDNLAAVALGPHCCLSQGVYLCTGNHDWSEPGFDLKTRPIDVGGSAWVAAFVRVGPGVTIGEGAVVQLGSVVVDSVAPGAIAGGNPCREIGQRHLKNA